MKLHINKHLLSLVGLIFFLILAIGSFDVDKNSSEYKEAKEKLEKEGVIPTDVEINREKKYIEEIVGLWQLDSVIPKGGAFPNRYFQKEYKKRGDYIVIDEYTANGKKIRTQIGKDDNTPENKRPIGEKITDELTYSIDLDNLNEYSLGFTAPLKIARLDDKKLVLLYLSDNGGSETYYYTRLNK